MGDCMRLSVFRGQVIPLRLSWELLGPFHASELSHACFTPHSLPHTPPAPTLLSSHFRHHSLIRKKTKTFQTMTDSIDQDSPCPRPASPFFRHRPLGRAPSPPTWACYEQIPARSDLLGSSESDSDSGDAADEDSLSDADSSSSSASSSSASDDAEAAGLMDVESDKDEAAEPATNSPNESGDPEKRDKGKQRAEDPPNPPPKSVPVVHTRSRRHRGRRPPMSVLRPILTIQRSQGFVWNQVRISVLVRIRTSVYSHNETVLGSLRPTIHKGSLYVESISVVPIYVAYLRLLLPRCCFHFTTHHFWCILRLRFHVYLFRRL